MKRTNLDRAREYEADNLEAAREILAAPDRYGGEGSAQVDWARTVVERHERKEQREAAPLFACGDSFRNQNRG